LDRILAYEMEKIMKNSKLFTSLAVVGGLALGSQAYADTYLSIGSNPVGNTAYQWAAGISDVVNKNVSGVVPPPPPPKRRLREQRAMLRMFSLCLMVKSRLDFQTQS